MKPLKTTAVLAAMALSMNSQAIELKECRIGPESSPLSVKAECGTLAVAENRNNPSRMIDLNLAIVRTKSTEKKPDPVIMLSGGPGQAAVETYVQLHSAFKKVLKDRDVVLVDQRGTGKSNKIACNFDESFYTEDESIAFAALQKCVSELDADTRFYTTPESMKDLEEVRKALNIEKWNLVGISYGTRKALTYMKMFPDSIRSVVLDGVVPQQEPLAQNHEKNLVEALQKQFKYCEADETCKQTFGDVESQLWTLLAKLDEEKPVIRLQNPTTGNYEDVEFNKEFAGIAIRLLSYSPSTMRLLPLLIKQANDGELENLASQAAMITGMLQGALSNVEMSILCSEDAPFYDVSESPEQNIFGRNFLSRTQKSCQYWPHIKQDASFKDPVVSDIPTLLLSGELDPVTPPSFAEETMKTLSNSQHLVAKGQGHNVFPIGCMPKIMTQFINSPEEELDTECMEAFDTKTFFINMMGPEQ